MRQRMLLYAAAAGLLLSSCNDIREGTAGKVAIEFSIQEQVEVKSPPPVAEGEISDVSLFFYDEKGHQVLAEYRGAGAGEGISLQLPVGRNYAVYAVANAGDLTSFPELMSEENMKALCWHLDDSLSFMNAQGALPMAGAIDQVFISEGDVLFVPMVRLLSKFRLQLDLSGLDPGIRFIPRKVRICHLNRRVRFFGRSAAEKEEDVLGSGYTLSGEDLLPLCTSGVEFYLPENAQGDLLPDNGDETTHLPPAPYDRYSSYVEISVDYRSDVAYDENLIYRYYIHDGRQLDNFDVLRNTMYHCTTRFFGNGIHENSWRIDASGMKDLVTDVTVVPDRHEFSVLGSSFRFRADVQPVTAENNRVVWESSDESVATVDSEGNVVAKGDGACWITAVATDGTERSGSAEVVVDSYVMPESVSVIPAQAEIYVGGGLHLISEVSPAEANNPDVRWSSEDPSVAAVDKDGNVTGISPGLCRIVAVTADGNLSAGSDITVKERIFSISSFPGILYPEYNSPLELTYEAQPDGVPEFSLECVSGDPSAAVLEGMRLTAMNPSAVPSGEIGSYVLQGALNGKTLRVPFRVDAGLVDIRADVMEKVSAAGRYHLSLSSRVPADVAVKWSSSDPAVASVDEHSGLLSAHAEGRVEIRAESVTGAYDVLPLEVVKPSIHISGPGYMYEGESRKLDCESVPGAEIKWEILKGGDYMSVDENGTVFALKSTMMFGFVTVQASYKDYPSVLSTASILVLPCVSASLANSGNRMLNVSGRTSPKEVPGLPAFLKLTYSHAPSTRIFWLVYGPDGNRTDDIRISSDGTIKALRTANGRYRIIGTDASGKYFTDEVIIKVYRYMSYGLVLENVSQIHDAESVTYTYSMSSCWNAEEADEIFGTGAAHPLQQAEMLLFPETSGQRYRVSGNANAKMTFAQNVTLTTAYNPQFTCWDDISADSFLIDASGKVTAGRKGTAFEFSADRDFFYVLQNPQDFINGNF